MSVSQETKTLFSTGPIKFSDLRNNFIGQLGVPVKASDLYRETNPGVTNPVVPDADVNENIPAVDSGSSLNLSNFRGTIKEIILKQSGTDKNLYGDGADGWGSNLNRNIKKVLKIAGTVGSDEPSSASLLWSGDSNNLQIEVSGTIDGSFGAGGVLDNTNGEDGGKAVELLANHKIRFVVKPNGKIRGGGGGGAAGKSGNAGENGLDGNPGSDGTAGPAGAAGPGGVPGGDGGDAGIGGIGGSGASGGGGYADGTGTGGKGGDGGDGGRGGDGGAGGNGGAPGAAGSAGTAGTSGDGGRCVGIVEEKIIRGACGVDSIPDCPPPGEYAGGKAFWWKQGYAGDDKPCRYRGNNYERIRYCYKYQSDPIGGGTAGTGGAGGIGGAGGAGGRGGSGGKGGNGGAGGRGGSGGRGGVGGSGKGYLRTINTAQTGTSGGTGSPGAAGQAGGTGGTGSSGVQGEFGQAGQAGTTGTSAEGCPSGWTLVNSAGGGTSGGYGQQGGTGQSGGAGSPGGAGQAGEAGQAGAAGNPGTPGGVGGDYGQDGQATPFGTAGRGAAAIDGQSGQYHVIIEPANASFSAGVVLGAYQRGTTDTTSAPRTSFVKPQVPAATLTSASSILNEGGTMTFNVTTQNIPNGVSLFYTLSGFAIKQTDFQYNPDTDSTLFGAFIINSNAGTFNVVSVTDGLVEDDIQILVAVRRDDQQGEILAHKYITLTANAT